VERVIVEPTQVKQVYKNHEVAVHTITHFNLTELPDSCIVWQVEEDRKMLECLTGNPITCMAYPCGGVNNDDRVAEIIKNQTQIRFARTTVSTYSFVLQENLLQFNPTIHFGSERIFELAEEFLFLKVDEPKLFYIWGHTYELDAEEGAWERFEKLCQMISGKDDIFYGTNGEVFNG
jgi:peptidoglycan/xylan/chitin deacetylase (PgdA/CDA1 family)